MRDRPATRRTPRSDPVILAFLEGKGAEGPMERWRGDMVGTNSKKRVFRLPRVGARPGIRRQLRAASEAVAARFYHLLSSRAVSETSPKGGWGWTDSDECWWCGTGRQSREHLFKECVA